MKLGEVTQFGYTTSSSGKTITATITEAGTYLFVIGAGICSGSTYTITLSETLSDGVTTLSSQNSERLYDTSGDKRISAYVFQRIYKVPAGATLAFSGTNAYTLYGTYQRIG